MRKISPELLPFLTTEDSVQARGTKSCDGGRSFRKGTLSPALCHVLREVQREIGFEGRKHIGDVSNLDFSALICKVAERLGFDLSSYERDEVLSYIEHEENPFGLLQRLVEDRGISDIIITNYSSISIQQGRRNYCTDLRFPSQDVYEGFVERLLQRADTTYSTKKPIADGMIESYARVHAVHRALCDTGPYLTIRLNRFATVGLDDLTNLGLAAQSVIEYLQVLMQAGCTMLIVGEVGTGKTTLARALAGSIPADESILVIEDTPEIRLEHPHVRYITTREANSEGAGRITPSECIRAGMRMAMNRIIFGEIRDAEAAEAFIDVCASGHPGVSTIHGRSSMDAIARLELFLSRAQKTLQRAVLSEQIATAVQVIVHVNICKETGRRRIIDVREIGPVADGVLRQRQIFQYQTTQGLPSWRVVNKISSYRDILENSSLHVELSALPSVLELNPEILFSETTPSQYS